MSFVSTIGVLGGMGPEATNRLCALITELTPVSKDQDHIPVITFNNSLIPERVGAIAGKTKSPLPEMIRTARVLEQAGADMLLMPCNLAHYFIDEVQREIRVPLLNMIEETVKHVVARYPNVRKVGLLASTQTIKHGLYHRSFAQSQRDVLSPEASEQESKVMEAIYGPEGIKCGHKDVPRAMLMEAALKLAEAGAQLMIAGCTEVSLVLERGLLPFPVVDPMEIIARVAIEKARAGYGRRAVAGDLQASAF
jgi:aspartate racemase